MPNASEPDQPTGPPENTNSPAPSGNGDDLVITPRGQRPRRLVHQLEEGQHISTKDGRVRIIDTATGNVIKDLGESNPPAPGGPGSPDKRNARAASSPAAIDPGIPDTGWIENSQWRNGASEPINYFSTKWVVPPAPSTVEGELLFLFNGMQPDSGAHILQPVLQWGVSAAGGGNYWAITNWYADGQGGAAVYKPLVQVGTGDVLEGVITCTGQSGSEYSYTSTFTGYSSTSVAVSDIDELTWAYETLECYQLQNCSDYPNTPCTPMYAIQIKTGAPGTSGSDASISWTPVTTYVDCGQSCKIVSDASPGGAVYLYFRKVTGAASGGALTCFGVGGTATRVYMLDGSNHVQEVAWTGGWSQSDITAVSGAPSAIAGSALTCFGVGGTATRVYFLDSSGHVHELAWSNGWNTTDVTSKAGAAAAAAGSALTCFGVGGTDTRVYYLDGNGHVHELAWSNGWSTTDVTSKSGAPAAKSGSALTCFGVDGTDTRVYYLDGNGHVHELAWSNGWNTTDVTSKAGAVGAASGSALTCFGVGGTATRVYFLDSSGHVHELAWSNGWNTTDVTSKSVAPAAKSGSPLTCFGVGGTATRVYYLDSSGHVHELAWSNGWSSSDVTGSSGAPAAASNSTLTCFGVGGTATRTYCVNGSGELIELAWENGGWVWSIA